LIHVYDYKFTSVGNNKVKAHALDYLLYKYTILIHKTYKNIPLSLEIDGSDYSWSTLIINQYGSSSHASPIRHGTRLTGS
jgi:hypothetical protein